MVVLNVVVVLAIVVPWGRFQDDLRWYAVRWVPFLSPPFSVRDLIGNVALYLPLGYAGARLAGAPRGPQIAVACAAALALATEASQLFGNSRFPSMTDLVCNVLGAWVGARWAARRGAVGRG